MPLVYRGCIKSVVTRFAKMATKTVIVTKRKNKMAEERLVKVIEESQIDKMAASSHFELKWYPIGFKTKWRLEQFKTDFQRETPYWKKKTK